MTTLPRRLPGSGCAAIFNARARQVTPRVVRAFEQLLPGAMVRVSDDLTQLRRQAAELIALRPEVICCGGGDGAATQLYNALLTASDDPPPLALLRLGTGNAWARTSGAPSYHAALALLAGHRGAWEYRRQPLVKVEGIAAPFAGLGWDAQLLSDYQDELDHQSDKLFTGSLRRRVFSGLGGYLWSAARRTLPLEWRASFDGWPHLTVTSLDDEALALDDFGQRRAASGVLYRGPAGVLGLATITDYGFGLRAFPLAGSEPDRVNLRVFSGALSTVLRNLWRIWRGTTGVPGLHDYFVKRARIECSRPIAFQIAGDSLGVRESIEVSASVPGARVIDWKAITGARLGRRSDDRIDGRPLPAR